MGQNTLFTAWNFDGHFSNSRLLQCTHWRATTALNSPSPSLGSVLPTWEVADGTISLADITRSMVGGSTTSEIPPTLASWGLCSHWQTPLL